MFLLRVLYRKPAGKCFCENSSCPGVASCLIVSVPHAHGIVPRLSSAVSRICTHTAIFCFPQHDLFLSSPCNSCEAVREGACRCLSGCPCSLSRVTPFLPRCLPSSLLGTGCAATPTAMQQRPRLPVHLSLFSVSILLLQSQPKDLRPEEAHTPGGFTAVCRGEAPLIKCPELPGIHGLCCIYCPPFLLF